MSDKNFTRRPLTLDDAQRFVETAQAISAHIGTNRSYQADFIRSQWQEPTFDLSKSSQGIFTEAGNLVAYVVMWDHHDVPVHPWIEWGVHPDYLGHNLGIALLNWADKRRLSIIERCPANARVSFHSGTLRGYKPAEDTLRQAGYEAIRYGYEMRIDMESKPPAPAMPEGIVLRTYRHDADLHDFVHAFQDSFSDHFGYVEDPFSKAVREFRHWFETDKLFDPELVFLGIDAETGKIAGYVLGLKEEHGDPSVGYIDLVGVRRAYRRRGLAQALLYQAFNAYWHRDQRSVTLGVDSDSLTNAVKLYERVGMYIHRQFVHYEKLVRDGQELATVSIE